jgi:hypothetical protein
VFSHWPAIYVLGVFVMVRFKNMEHRGKSMIGKIEINNLDLRYEKFRLMIKDCHRLSNTI